jgi:hypothetical protein
MVSIFGESGVSPFLVNDEEPTHSGFVIGISQINKAIFSIHQKSCVMPLPQKPLVPSKK